MRRRRDRGALLGIVLVLMVVLLAGGAFAMWTLSNDTDGARNDRLNRQLFDCADQGLAFGKQWFGITQRASWDQFLSADVCNAAGSVLPCKPSGPFPTGASGTAPAGYPSGLPYTNTVTVGAAPTALTLTYQVGIYNNSENVTPAPNCGQVPPDPTCAYHDGDNTIVVYSTCAEPGGQSRYVQAVLSVPPPNNGCQYRGQLGFNCNNTNNAN